MSSRNKGWRKKAKVQNIICQRPIIVSAHGVNNYLGIDSVKWVRRSEIINNGANGASGLFSHRWNFCIQRISKLVIESYRGTLIHSLLRPQKKKNIILHLVSNYCENSESIFTMRTWHPVINSRESIVAARLQVRGVTAAAPRATSTASLPPPSGRSAAATRTTFITA